MTKMKLRDVSWAIFIYLITKVINHQALQDASSVL